MSWDTRLRSTLAAVVTFAFSLIVTFASPAFSQTTASNAPPGGDPWPRDASVAGAKISIFQPQLESWNGNLLDACSAVTIKTPGNDESNYGVIPDGEHAARRAGDGRSRHRRSSNSNNTSPSTTRRHASLSVQRRPCSGRCVRRFPRATIDTTEVCRLAGGIS